jgi:hypothetical protein
VHDASEPVVVFDVLSKSTGWYDQTRKLKDDESVSVIPQYICISESEPRVSEWLRDDAGQLVPQEDIAELDAELTVVGLQVPLHLADIYAECASSGELPAPGLCGADVLVLDGEAPKRLRTALGGNRANHANEEAFAGVRWFARHHSRTWRSTQRLEERPPRL